MVYIPLDEEMKVKRNGIVDFVSGRVAKAGGALIQSTLIVVRGFFISSAVKFIDIAPYLSTIFLAVCGLWMFAVKCQGQELKAITAAQQKSSY
jgi:AAA family ATP:ADP antiporter